MVCGTPRPGFEPVPPAVKVWSPNHWTTREVRMIFLKVSNLAWQVLQKIYLYQKFKFSSGRDYISVVPSVSLQFFIIVGVK